MDCRQYEITPNEFVAEIYIKRQKYYIVVGLESTPQPMIKKGVYYKPSYETLVNASNPGCPLNTNIEDQIIAYLEYRIKAFNCLLDYLRTFNEKWYITYNKNSHTALSLEIVFKESIQSRIPPFLIQYLKRYEDETVINIPIPNQPNSSTPINESAQRNVLRIVKDATDFIYYPNSWSALA